MANSTIGDGDFSKYLLVKQRISVALYDLPAEKDADGFVAQDFKRLIGKHSLKLQVLFNGTDLIGLKPPEKEDDKSKKESVTHWTLACDIPMLPFLNDELKFHLTIGQTELKDFSLKYTKIAKEFELAKKAEQAKAKTQSKGKVGARQNDEVKFPLTPIAITFTKTQANVTVKLTLHVNTASVGDLFDEDLPKQTNHEILDFVTESIEYVRKHPSSEDLGKLLSILDSVPIPKDVVQVVEGAISELTKIHPLANAAFTLLSIPYKLMKEEKEFQEKLTNLFNAMLSTSKCLMDARYHVKIMSAEDLFTSIMRTFRDAALFIGVYLGKHRLVQFVNAQFPKQLEDFANDLVTKKNDFLMTAIVQIARSVDNQESMTTGDFLLKRLRPVRMQPLEGGCLEGTRVKLLDEVRKWLENPKTENILWIFGPPGAGKSTIATSIVKELGKKGRDCVKFFCKRDEKRLRDPRQIWRTLAYGLADKHAGLKAAIMRTLDESRGDPQDYLVEEQFERLIKGPLETDMEETSSLTNKLMYPVIIIDALDECYSAGENYDNWNSLLVSLERWSKISGKIKLIVTSRNLPKIQKSIEPVSHAIDLSTRMDESKGDVMTLFATNFTEIREDFEISDLWPSKEELTELTEYAAGLIGWADSVIKYVGANASGADPCNRLKQVLNGIAAGGGASALGDYNRVYLSYARILFEAFRPCYRDERNKAKGCLAAVVLRKEPLGMDDLVELLSTEPYAARNVQVVESILWMFRPIISKNDGDGVFQVCHKSVSDFLMSRRDSGEAMKFVVEQWNRQMPDEQVYDSDPHSFILDCAEESKHLALACLRLIHRTFTNDVESISGFLEESDGALFYARRYWFAHYKDAEPGMEFEKTLARLADAMDAAFGCTEQFVQQSVPTNTEAKAVIKCLGDAADAASRYIEVERSAEDVNAVRQELDGRTTKLDSARSKLESTLRGRQQGLKKEAKIGIRRASKS